MCMCVNHYIKKSRKINYLMRLSCKRPMEIHKCRCQFFLIISFSLLRCIHTKPKTVRTNQPCFQRSNPEADQEAYNIEANKGKCFLKSSSTEYKTIY